MSSFKKFVGQLEENASSWQELPWRRRDATEDEDDAVVPVLFETLPEKEGGGAVVTVESHLTEIQ